MVILDALVWSGLLEPVEAAVVVLVEACSLGCLRKCRCWVTLQLLPVPSCDLSLPLLLPQVVVQVRLRHCHHPMGLWVAILVVGEDQLAHLMVQVGIGSVLVHYLVGQEAAVVAGEVHLVGLLSRRLAVVAASALASLFRIGRVALRGRMEASL